ncbi:MAG: primosomal protein N', partial [Acidobacteriota bacterium]
MRILVAVPVPQLGLLTYRMPDGAPCPAIGARVVVPLGTRAVTGLVVGEAPADGDSGGLDVKDVRAVLDTDAFVPADVVALALWT